jgi:FMN reductase
MGRVVVLTGSPGANAMTLTLAGIVRSGLAARGLPVSLIEPRTIAPESLIMGRQTDPVVQEAAQLIEQADAVVVITPVYKASFSGLLKTFLDLLPQFAFTGKLVLPLAVGGTLSHVLSIDYGLRPVLCSMNARWVLNGVFLLDKWIDRTASEPVVVDAGVRERLNAALDELQRGLTTTLPQTPPLSSGAQNSLADRHPDSGQGPPAPAEAVS